MPTRCRPLSFAFQGCRRRRVMAAFDGGSITSNAGALLLREIDRFVGLFDRVAACFKDHRDPRLTEHSVRTLVAQRITGIALGYEDLNDHDDPRHDPLLALLAGRLEGRRKGCAALAGKSTLNRLEHAPGGGKPGRCHRIGHDPDALRAVLVELFIDSWRGKPPSRLVLDIDSTDDEVHGRQEGRFFHGYYGHYCFPPLYITCGGRPLFAQLRPGNSDPAGGVTAPLGRIIERLRQESFDDREIGTLIEMPKARAGTHHGFPSLRQKRGHVEASADYQGADGTEFRVVLRRSSANPMAFSAILMVRVSESNRWFRLRRYNGRHWHRNRIEGDRFRDFHIHTAAERYQLTGRREDAYAEPTDRFSNYEGAVGCLQQDAGLTFGPDEDSDQLGLELKEAP